MCGHFIGHFNDTPAVHVHVLIHPILPLPMFASSGAVWEKAEQMQITIHIAQEICCRIHIIAYS